MDDLKVFKVTTTGKDYQWDDVRARNKTDARKQVELYFRQWDVKVDDFGFTAYDGCGRRPRILAIEEVR